MPKRSKSKSKVRNASAQRWSKEKTLSSSDSSDEDYSMDVDDPELTFSEKLCLNDIGDLTEMCKSKYDSKYLSTLLYMSLRYFNIKWEDVDDFLTNIGLMTAETSHKWANIFMQGDYEEFSNLIEEYQIKT
jgi:hypothetical protein